MCSTQHVCKTVHLTFEFNLYRSSDAARTRPTHEAASNQITDVSEMSSSNVFCRTWQQKLKGTI